MSFKTNQNSAYDLRDKIGESPWTVVHAAWDMRQKRDVAIKSLRVEFQDNDHVKALFHQRCKTLGDISNDRTLRIFSVDASTNSAVLELADSNITRQVRQGRIAPGQVQSYLAQVLEALVHFHKTGRPHGQIKPNNLMWFQSGRVKLTDPGVLVEGKLQLQPGEGKYLAPELVDKQGNIGTFPVQPQLDLYTLGFCALEMLAGPEFDRHFEGMTGGATEAQHKLWGKWHASDDDPRRLVTKIVPSSAADLAAVLNLMLRKSLAERASSAKAMRQLLGESIIIVDDPKPTISDVKSTVAQTEAGNVSRPRVKRRPIPEDIQKAIDERKRQARRRASWKLAKKGAIAGAGLLLSGAVIYGILTWTSGVHVASTSSTEMIPETSPVKLTRVVQIKSSPPGAQVFINDKLIEPKTPCDYQMEQGVSYRVKVFKEDFTSPEVQRVEINENTPKELIVSFNLVESPSKVTKNVPDVIKPTIPSQLYPDMIKSMTKYNKTYSQVMQASYRPLTIIIAQKLDNTARTYQEAEQYELAMPYSQQAIKLLPHHDFIQRYALLLLQAGRLPEALVQVEQAIKQNPMDTDAYILKARILYGMSTSSEDEPLKNALICLDHAVDHGSKRPEAYSLRGVIHFKMKNKQNAVDDYRRAISLESDKTQISKYYVRLGNVLANMERYDDSVTAYTESIKLNPTDEAYANRGRVYLQLEKDDLAKQDAEMAQKMKAANKDKP